MEKIYIDDNIMAGAKLIDKAACGSIYTLKNGEILKVFHPSVLRLLNFNYSLENKILSAKPIEEVPEILIPTRAVYDHHHQFVAYTMPRADGIDYNEYEDNFTMARRADLKAYGTLFYKLSNIVERANNNGIIMPDLCTCDNIFIHGGKISMIDYDGLQVGKHKAYTMSTTLGNEKQYYIPKYMKGNYFTPELDKKSLVLLYFLSTFNVNLMMAGQINPHTGQPITLDDIATLLGIQDNDFMQKVYNTLSSDKPGEYIGEDVMRLADEYTMQCFKNPINGCYIKKLFKK